MRSFPFPNPFLFFFSSSASPLRENPRFSSLLAHTQPRLCQGHGLLRLPPKTGPDKSFSSGAFGCVRNHGYKFHEGLDLYPVKGLPWPGRRQRIFRHGGIATSTQPPDTVPTENTSCSSTPRSTRPFTPSTPTSLHPTRLENRLQGTGRPSSW